MAIWMTSYGVFFAWHINCLRVSIKERVSFILITNWAMKMFVEVEVDLHTRNLSARRRWVVILRREILQYQQRNAKCHCLGSNGTEMSVWAFGKCKVSFPAVNRIPVVQPVVSDYNDWAIPNHLMTDDFKVGNGLKQGDGLPLSLFHSALEWVIRCQYKLKPQCCTNQCS